MNGQGKTIACTLLLVSLLILLTFIPITALQFEPKISIQPFYKASIFETNLLCTISYGSLGYYRVLTDSSVQTHPTNLSNATKPNSTLSVTTPTRSPLTANSIWLGPHVIVNGTWNELSLAAFPTLKIKQTTLEFITAEERETYGTIDESDPILAGWHPDHNPREDYEYIHLEKDQPVYVEVEFGSWTAGEGSTLSHGLDDDIDVFVWPPAVEHTYANGFVLGHGGNPEVGWFIAPVTGMYTIGLDYYSGVIPMGWRCCLQ